MALFDSIESILGSVGNVANSAGETVKEVMGVVSTVTGKKAGTVTAGTDVTAMPNATPSATQAGTVATAATSGKWGALVLAGVALLALLYMKRR